MKFYYWKIEFVMESYSYGWQNVHVLANSVEEAREKVINSLPCVSLYDGEGRCPSLADDFIREFVNNSEPVQMEISEAIFTYFHHFE